MGSRENSKQVQTSINLIFGALVRIHYLASTYCFITTKMLVVETETRCNWYWAGFLSSNTIILLHPNKMTLYSNRVLSCCSAWIAEVQSVMLLFLFSYGTISLSSDCKKPRKKLISAKLLNSPWLIILSANQWCLLASVFDSIDIRNVLLPLQQ